MAVGEGLLRCKDGRGIMCYTTDMKCTLTVIHGGRRLAMILYGETPETAGLLAVLAPVGLRRGT